jgi:LacI family transcriptional regulator, galactose operon repressor
MNNDRASATLGNSLGCRETDESWGQKRVTVYDIARSVGVSHTTVARALRDSKDVTKTRREEIQRVASEMGYYPDPRLTALANYRKALGPISFHGVVAWINRWQQPDQLRKFGEFERYWRGAEEVAGKHGFKLEDFRWAPHSSAKRLENMLVARGVEAVLIPPHNDLLDWREFDWSKFSVLRFGMSVQSPDSNLVTADQFRATVMAVTRMSEYGYRRIGLAVDFDLDEHLGGNYHGGFLWAQNKRKMNPQVPPFIASAALHRRVPEEEAKNLRCWLVQYQPDAILTTQAYVPQLLRELGYRIPEDIAVAGTSVCDIPVDAGIDQRSVEIGRIAMQMLIKQIHVGERGTPSNPCRILVESQWQDGQSLPRRN